MSVWTDLAENLTVDTLFGSATPPATYYVGLYLNTTEPGEDAVMADILEPGGGGYARLPLVKDTDWTILGSIATGDEVTFGATGPWANVYGYFITTEFSGTGGLLLVAQDLVRGPYTIGAGDSVRVIPKLTCK